MRDDHTTGGERAVAAAPVLSPASSGELFETWRNLDVPEGWRAEIIGERIVMSPPPGHAHNLVADRLHRALVRGSSDDWAIFQTAGVSVSSHGGLFVPDLLVIPRDRVPADTSPDPVPAALALLVVEITSPSNPDTDRISKLAGYARAEVPLYLLVDRHAPEEPAVSLYSEPSDGHYRRLVRVPFGESLTVPEPFGLELDTSDF